MKNKIHYLIIRLKVIFFILLNPKESWFMIHISKEDIEKIFTDKDFSIDIKRHRMHPHIIDYIIYRAAKDDIDIILDRSTFEYEAEERFSKK